MYCTSGAELGQGAKSKDHRFFLQKYALVSDRLLFVFLSADSR
jgi:hypothetical protein